ncbi:MAG: V-type ATP synthase subunit F [Candidatus Izemoplasmatales bacterium]|jgi:V/A-type H+-transporting ATPase subunit F|nr:V-type ATP synthase subunit F [Candidatus Izemoplasmatales bacterium]MDD4354616.1 V-type ATP synthase subunit F [Candidatus Izemoplasmatales bacterium]MDD4987650.1 V-type ATP synthase subunit F [Candidatus Izemoplasmatales bacterium]MDY0372876.1 V-type ATP synthase subunit F [Candidatus Izemoplasmatales bacterium]NLF49124.1 V-type ATP synthase subunit F [Acholeplasmataceae bacterium]
MEKTQQIAIVGLTDAILLFNTVGVRAFQVKDAGEAERTISSLANRKCKLIFVTEDIYEAIPETIEKYQQLPYPILMVLPIDPEKKNIGMKKIKQNVENAIGIDLF